MRVLIMISFLSWGLGAFAQDEGADESQIRTAARERLYAGGVDEEPLQVQAHLPDLKKGGSNEAPTTSNDAD